MKRLNLLPPQKQSELYFDNLFHSVLVAIGIAIFVLILGVVVQIATWFYLNQNLSLVDVEIEGLKRSSNKTENAELKTQIKAINIQMTDFENLSKSSPNWSKVLQAFAKQVPKGVKISNLDADAATGKIQISGYAATRELVIELYNNINADKEIFKDIDYPLENVAKPVDVQFKFTFFVQDGVLVPKK